MSIQTAAGYTSLKNSPLSRPAYYEEILARVVERDFLMEITNTAILDRITQCNQTVQIMKQPYVPAWRSYQKNQEIIANHIESDATCINICNAAYNAIKIEKLDVYFTCGLYDSWEESFLDALYERYVEMQRDWVLTAMILEASPKNKGRNAGKWGMIDLGSVGNPVTVNSTNIARRITDLQVVLTDALHWTNNEMFLIVPNVLMTVISTSNLSNAAWTGSCKPCSFNVDGILPSQLVGFNVIMSNHLPVIPNADGTVSFYVLAGNSSGFAYASDIIEGRIVEAHTHFSFEYQMLAVWGGKAIYPEALAVGLWTLDLT